MAYSLHNDLSIEIVFTKLVDEFGKIGYMDVLELVDNYTALEVTDNLTYFD